MAYGISGSPASVSGGTVTVPSPAYSGVFIPTLWSGKLIEKFYNATVLAAISNTDYEGEINNLGDKVIIRTKPTITIADYAAYGSLGAPQAPSSAKLDLNIDKGKYWNTIIDDVMEIQADIDQMSSWADDASEQMKINIDRDVLTNIATVIENGTSTGGENVVGTAARVNAGPASGPLSLSINLGKSANNGSGTPLSIDRNTVIDFIVNAGNVLDEYNIPETGRWLIIPAWMAALIKRSELRDASLTGDGSTLLRNGRLGMIDRFTLYMSNLLPNSTSTAAGKVGYVTGGAAYALATGEFRLYFGHSGGLTFASQLTKLETLRAESTFGTVMRGLQVYGYQVTDNSCLGTAICVKA